MNYNNNRIGQRSCYILIDRRMRIIRHIRPAVHLRTASFVGDTHTNILIFIWYDIVYVLCVPTLLTVVFLWRCVQNVFVGLVCFGDLLVIIF